MLKVWVNPPEPKDEERVVSRIDFVFDDSMTNEVLEYDITKRILNALYFPIRSNDAEQRCKNDRGYLIDRGSIPEGVQFLLTILSPIAREDNLIYDYSMCGKNCDRFLEEIADMMDVEIILGRVYVPFVSGKPKSGVKFMESGSVVYDAESFIKEYRRLGGIG